MSLDLRSRGHQVQVCSCLLVLFALLYAVALTGCGGGGDAASGSGLASSARGAVTVLVPGSGQAGRAVLGRIIPASTQSFLILVLRNHVQLAEQRVTRTAQDQLVTISDIPVGLVDVIVRALDASGATVAEATLTGYLVQAGTNSPVTVNLTPVSPTTSPSPQASPPIYVLNGNGSSSSNKITVIRVPLNGVPTCVAAVDASLTGNATALPAGMLRWGSSHQPNPQATSYLYVANSTSTGGNVNRFAIDASTGLLTNQAEQSIPPIPPSPGALASPAFIGPARNTTGSTYTPPPHIYVLASSGFSWNAHPYLVGANGALTLDTASNIFSNAWAMSFLPDMSVAFLASQASIGRYTVGSGGSLTLAQFESALGTQVDTLVNATATFRYAYFLDASSNQLHYYAIGPAGDLVLPRGSVNIPDTPYKMTLVTRADFPAGDQYLYIACDTSIHCCRIQNGIPQLPTTGYSITSAGLALSLRGGIDTDPNGQSLWVTGTDDSNNSFASVFSIQPGPGSTASPGTLLPWNGMPIPVTDGAGNQMRGASAIIVKD